MITAIPARPVRASDPRNAYSRSHRQLRRPWLQNFSDNLMPWNQRRAQPRKVALDNVEVGPANAACEHTQKHLPGTRLRLRNLFDTKRQICNFAGTNKERRFHWFDQGSDNQFTSRSQVAVTERAVSVAPELRLAMLSLDIAFRCKTLERSHARSRELESRCSRNRSG